MMYPTRVGADPGQPSIRTAALAIALAATALGALQAVRLGMPSELGGARVPPGDALMRALGIWWLWALLTPVVIAVAKRWHPGRVGLWRSLAAHAGGAVLVSMMHSLIYVPVMLALVWPELLPRLEFVWRVNLVGNIPGDLVPYAALAGVFYAVDYSAGRSTVCTEAPEPHAAVPSASASAPQWLERIAVRAPGRLTLVPVGEIDWIQGSGDYAVLHCGERRHLAGERLATLATALDPAAFVRVHRSAIVRIDQIRELRPRTHGDSDIVLMDGRIVRSSRTYREALIRALAGLGA